MLGRIGFPASFTVPRLTRLLSDENRDVQLAAIRALGEFGPAAAEAVPGLIAQLDEYRGSFENSPSKTLSRIGAAAVPALLETMRKEQRTHFGAVDALKAMGPAARDGIPDLFQMVIDGSPPLKIAALQILAAIGPESKLVMADLVAARRTAGEADRPWFDQVFWHIGKPAVPLLAAELETESDQHRVATIEVLRRIGPEASEALPILGRLLHVENRLVNFPAARAYVEIGGIGKDATSVLRAMISDLNPAARAEGFEAIAKARDIDTQKAFWADIDKALDDKSPHVRLAAAKALLAVDNAAASTVLPVLGELLDADDNNSRLALEAVRIVYPLLGQPRPYNGFL